MRRIAAVIMGVVMIGELSWALGLGAAKVGEDVTIPGTLCCAACKLGGSPDHKCSKECCQGCMKGGDSVLLEDKKGFLYLLIGKEKGKPVVSGEQLDLVGEKVTINGTLVEKGGLKGIYVESISKIAKE